jgi:hypothetical protein
MVPMPLSPIPTAVPDLGSTVMLASLDPAAFTVLGVLVAICLGIVWLAARPARRPAQRRPSHQIHPIRQPA